MAPTAAHVYAMPLVADRRHLSLPNAPSRVAVNHGLNSHSNERPGDTLRKSQCTDACEHAQSRREQGAGSSLLKPELEHVDVPVAIEGAHASMCLL